MDKKKDKREVIAVRIFKILLLIYIVLFISKTSGYYEFQTHKQVELNEEAMKRFEKDVSEGKNVTLTDYIKERDIKYNNKASDLGYKISCEISNILTNGLDGTMSFFGQLFTS